MTDERRELIQQAMAAHDGREWTRDVLLVHYAPGPGHKAAAATSRVRAHSIALTHNAIRAAAELIEELTVNGSESNRRISVLMVEGAELLDRTEKAEATIATQAKEIERLREDGDATRERSNGWAVAAVEAARCVDDHDAIIAEQAKEIERLKRLGRTHRAVLKRCEERLHPGDKDEMVISDLIRIEFRKAEGVPSV